MTENDKHSFSSFPITNDTARTFSSREGMITALYQLVSATPELRLGRRTSTATLKTLGDALLFVISKTHENDRIERMRGNELEAMKDEEGGSIVPTDPSRKLRNTYLEAWSF